jgi:hypothetical protein
MDNCFKTVGGDTTKVQVQGQGWRWHGEAGEMVQRARVPILELQPFNFYLTVGIDTTQVLGVAVAVARRRRGEGVVH